MNVQAFRERLAADQSAETLFELGREIAIEIAIQGAQGAGLIEAIIRFADAIDRSLEEVPASLHEMRSALLRHAGLFPYADPNHLSFRDQLAYEAYRSDADKNIVYHREQLGIIERLEAGRNVILSAPTSFGKSLIIDILCSSSDRRRIVIIVPTIALIDETKRRLFSRLGEDSQLIWNENQIGDPDRRHVYVLTQERALSRTDLTELDLLVVDEFYKIDASHQDPRTISLGLAVRRLVQQSRQFFMLGPMISTLLWRAPRINYEFVQTDFRTVAVDIERIKTDGSTASVASFVANEAIRPTLVFCSSPDRAREMCVELIKRLPVATDNVDASSLAEWTRQHFHEDWFASAAIERGIGIHTGRVPRALAQLEIELFDRGVLDVLVCTSSIIEGVNTAAKSVVIADRQIDRTPIDFFTHENIKGRSGRMFRHFVGKVYLFHDPPPQDRTEIDLEYVDGSALPDAFVAGLDAGEDPPLVARQQSLSSAIGLSSHVIREFSALSISNLESLVRGVRKRMEANRFGICWDGIPPWPRLKSTIELIWESARPRTTSAPTAPSALRLLTIAAKQKNVGAFIREVAINDRDGVNHGIDIALAFLKVMEYDLPLRLAALEAIIKDIWDDSRAQAVDYSRYISVIKSWFSVASASAFEEAGLPAQLVEKYASDARDETLSAIVSLIRDRLDDEPENLLTHAEHLFLSRVLPIT
jgi:hypothetical protein